MSNYFFNQGIINGKIVQAGSDESECKKMAAKEKKVLPAAEYQYDVAISYASEQEHYVSRVAKILEKEGLKVFYAPNREEEFFGRDMITEFYDIYHYESLYVACFISEEYLKKDITVHEARTALLRNKYEKRNCLIPICFGGARLEGMDPDIHFLDADRLREVEVADKLHLIIKTYREKN